MTARLIHVCLLLLPLVLFELGRATVLFAASAAWSRADQNPVWDSFKVSVLGLGFRVLGFGFWVLGQLNTRVYIIYQFRAHCSGGQKNW